MELSAGSRLERSEYRAREYPLFNPQNENPSLSSQEFEFAGNSLFGSGMIPADEIFRNGRMIPCSYDLENSCKRTSGLQDHHHQQQHKQVTRQNSMPAAAVDSRSSRPGNDHSASVTCSSRWQSILDRALLRSRTSKKKGADNGDHIPRDSFSSSRRHLLLSSSSSSESSSDWTMEPLLFQPARSSLFTAASRDQSTSSTMALNKKLAGKHLNQRVDTPAALKPKPTMSQVYPRSDSCTQTSQAFPRRLKESHSGSVSTRSNSSSRSYGGSYDPEVSGYNGVKLLNMPVCMGDSLKLGVFDHQAHHHPLQNSRRKK